jgi:hypothetical protein
MVTRNALMAAAVGLSVSLLAQPAAGAEVPEARKAPKAAEPVVDAQLFRDDIDAYVREHGRQLREALNEELRRELSGKIVLATNELRTRS